MDAFVGLVTVLMIIGLINPSLLLRWDKNPTRLKVVAYGIGLMSVVWLWLMGARMKEQAKHADTLKQVEKVREYVLKEMYVPARMYLDELEGIDTSSPYYHEVVNLTNDLDSLESLYNKRRNEELKKKNLQELQQNLISEIHFLDNSFDPTNYRGSIPLLESEIKLFESWGELVQRGQGSSSDEVKKLANSLRGKVEKTQRREFPILRREYVKIAKQKMWIEDIEVSSWGSSITFTGGTFVSNRNISEFNSVISETLMSFRFKRVNYKWIKLDDEYTYYKLYGGKDSDI